MSGTGENEEIRDSEIFSSNSNTNETGPDETTVAGAGEGEVAEAAVEKTPEDSVPAGISATGGEVAASAKEQEDDDEAGVALGDRFKFISTRYGGEVKGMIYYNDGETLIRVLPLGVSNKLYDFPLVDGDFDPDYVDEAPIRMREGPGVGFVELNGFRVDQKLLTITKDGEAGPTYTITMVNAEEDRITIRNDADGDRDIDFGFTGIPLDAPFVIMRIQQQPIVKEEAASPEQEKDNAKEKIGDENDEGIEFLEDFELPDFAIVKEIATAERIYPEISQKSELLADLVSLVDGPSQQNPNIIRRIRALVEMASALKNSIIRRGRDGSPEGEEKISIDTLSDLLQNRSVPIARPVLETTRVLYGDEEKVLDQIHIKPLIDTIDASIVFIDKDGGIPAGEPGVGDPRWYQVMSAYFRKFPLGDETTAGGNFGFPEDAEYFRHDIPLSGTVDGLQALQEVMKETTKGQKKTKGKVKIEIESLEDYVAPINFSLRRAHGPTLRPLEKGATAIAIPSTKANVNGYVLFPYKAAQQGFLGSTRTGKLWDNIQRGSAKKYGMSELLEILGGISDEIDASMIIAVPVSDTTMIRIPFSDYLQMILKSIVPRGPGDLHSLKADLGISDREMDLDQQKVINDRVKQVLASLMTHINTLREDLLKPTPPPSQAPILNQAYTDRIHDIVRSHPALEEIVRLMGQRTPGYKDIDIAITGSLLKYAKDYFMAVLGGQKRLIERERIRFMRDRLTSKLQDINALEELDRTKGQEPQPNPCEHTTALNMVRSTDEELRMPLLGRFVANYRGEREDNWVNCNICKKHLICQHEILQIQQYLHPKEYDILQKDIVLNYAGGSFGIHHICRNCGLPIIEVGYDNHIEFNDEGKPLMGRTELVDKDAMNEEAWMAALGVRIQKEDDIKFESEVKTELYQVLRVLVDRIGIDMDGPSYITLVDRLSAEVSVTISPKEYSQLPKDRRRYTYEQVIAQMKVAASAALLLIHIQNHQPEYIQKYTVAGCKPGFGGFPLNADADPLNQDQSPGIYYMVCALKNLQGKGMPWTASFQAIPKEETREETLKTKIINYTRRFAEDVMISMAIEKKRKILIDQGGKHALRQGNIERLPPNFLPRMEAPVDAAAAAAGQPTVAEGAKGQLGDSLKADAWIRGANQAAAAAAQIIKGSPCATTNCCASPIQNPDRFWNETRLPPAPELYKLKPAYAFQTLAYTPMIPRELQPFNAVASLNIAYLVFLQLCYKGPRLGLPHELGYDHKCDWCELEIPSKYLFPDVNLDGTLRVNEEELKSSLDTQGVVITQETFNALLDASHKHMIVETYIPPVPETPEKIVDKIADLAFPPVADFVVVLRESQKLLVGLGPASAGADIATALAPLRDSIRPAEDILARRLGAYTLPGPNKQTALRSEILKSILTEQPSAIFEIVRSYFLIPIQRILTQFNPDETLTVPKYYKLSEIHNDMLEKILNTHTSYCKQFSLYPDENPDSLKKALYKCETYVEQVSEILHIAQEIRISRVKFEKTMTDQQTNAFLRVLVRVLVYGPLGQLVDPNELPIVDGEPYAAPAGQSDDFISRLVKTLLMLYTTERKSYNPTAVRLEMKMSQEREAMTFLGKLDRLNDEERQIELLKKRAGIGEWAIGGTKLVYQYDPDQWEKNRLAVSEDYATAVGVGNEGLPDEEGTQYDGEGFVADADGEPAEGYDIVLGDQDAKDDTEMATGEAYTSSAIPSSWC
jgi:hypothetical protein